MARAQTQLKIIPVENPKYGTDLVHRIEDLTTDGKHTRTQIYAAIKAGELIARKCGRRTLILDADYRKWLAALPVRKVA